MQAIQEYLDQKQIQDRKNINDRSRFALLFFVGCIIIINDLMVTVCDMFW